MCCAVLCLVIQSCLTLWDPMECSPPGSSVHGNSPGKSTGVGCHSLLQEIFPTQGSNPGLPHCRQIVYLQPPREAQLRCCVTSQFLWLFHWQLYVPNHYFFFFFSQKLQSMFWFKKPNSLATLLFFCQSLNVNYLGSLTGAYPLLILPFSFSDA